MRRRLGSRWIEKERWNTTKKHAMDVIFNAKNSQLFTRFSPSEEILSVNGKNRPVAKIFQLSIFVLSREKCHYQSYWIRTFRFFFPCFGFLSPLGKSERHYQRYGVFSVLGAIIQKNSANDINLTEWRERRVTCQQLIGDIKYTRKNTISLISEETKNSATLSVFKRAVNREIYDSP